MGASYSSNTVDDAVDFFTEAVTTATQNCQTNVTLGENVNIIGNSGGVNIGTITGAETVSVNTSCLSANNTSNNIDSALEEAVSQVSKSISAALSLSFSESKNLTNLLTNLSTAVKQSYTQNCLNSFTENQNITIADNTGPVNITSVDWQETVSVVSTCVQNDSTVNDIKTMVQQQIAQKATSKTESLLGPLFAILLIVVIVIAAVLLGGVKALTNPKFIITIVVIIVIYIILAASFRWWPFKQKTSDGNDNGNVPPAPNTN